jgi:hypothetical protein
MKKSIVLSWIVFSFLITKSQEYKVRTDKIDEFSASLVKLLNCAVTDFNSCKGEHLQYTMMQENEYRLTIDFPGATAAIVRERDSWDKNAYIEFRGYADLRALQNGMKDLVKKIQFALGDQLNPDHSLHSGPDSSWFLSGMGLRDQNGFFSSNLELMSGSSASSSYLLEKTGNQNNDSADTKYFILLKVQRGIPAYYYYIKYQIAPPDKILDSVIRELVNAAQNDFGKYNKRSDSIVTRRYSDTILLNGHTVYFRFGGQHYHGTLMFPGSPGKNKFQEEWTYYGRVVQAALGSDYAYRISSYDGKPSIVYFRKDYKPDQPRIYLEAGEDNTLSPVIFIRIESSMTHPVKRNLSYLY